MSCLSPEQDPIFSNQEVKAKFGKIDFVAAGEGYLSHENRSNHNIVIFKPNTDNLKGDIVL